MRLGGYMIMLITMLMILPLLGINTGTQNILSYVGINIDTTTGTLNSADIESSSFWDIIFNTNSGILFIVGTAGAILIGLFGKGYDTSLVIVGFIIAIATAIAPAFYSIIMYMQSTGQSWATNIIAVIFVGVGIGFTMSCLDYFAGR